MNEKTIVHLPVPVGKDVWLVSKTGFVFRNKVIRYIIGGDNPHLSRIVTAYVDEGGEMHKRFVAMNQVGRTVFATEQEAIKAAREMPGV